MSDRLIDAIESADPAEVTEEQLNAWAAEATSTADDPTRAAQLHALAGLTALTPFARLMIAEWTGLPDPELQRAGWLALTTFAESDTEAAPELFEAYLQRMEAQILTASDGMQHAMATAIVAIAARDPELEEYAADIAARLLGQQ